MCATAIARPPNVDLKNGRLYVDGKWVFLKVAKPLVNYAQVSDCESVIRYLPILKEKNYNAIEINCYWHHFDQTGEARDLPTAGLVKLISAIADAGMFPCLSVETYGVGGGQLPPGFWEKHPDAIAIDANGRKVQDDEYGVMSAVPSLFSPEYLAAARRYIRHITRALPHEKFLWFETTVEPQYMGNHALDFSVHARRAFEAWIKRNSIANAPAWPDSFPVPHTFLTDPAWNRFRAEWLADWINDDAAVFRDVAGKGAYIAVDYLETCGPDMLNRNGDSLVFLRHLTAPDIIQVNWHWHNATHSPNQCAYNNVRKVMNETNRDWAISEHMTINGSDYSVEDMPALLRNTIKQSTGLAWEFVSVTPNSSSNFACYNDDWSPKAQIKVVDDQWEQWLAEIRAAHAGER